MVNRQPVVLDAPPFIVNASLSAIEVATCIEQCFERVSQWPDRVSGCFELLADLTGLEADAPLRIAGLAIASDMDAGRGAGDTLPYHNRQHFCEVMLAAHYIALRADVPKEDRARLLVAALIHDFGHDGGTNLGALFKLERQALQLATPYLARAGVSAQSMQYIGAAVLATDVVSGLPRARAWYRFHFQGQARPEGDEPAAELGVFATCPECSRTAVLLAEADALGSVGLTPGYAHIQQQRLAREWGRPLGPAEQFHYLDEVFGEFMVADFFAPNLEQIRKQD